MSKVFRNVSFFLTISFIFFATISPAQAASNFTIDTTSTINLNTDGSASVRNVYDVRNLSRNIVLSSYTVTVPLEDVSGLSASSGGRSIPVKADAKTIKSGDIEVKIQEITVEFPVKTSGQNRKWQFVVSYNSTGFLENKGGVQVFYHPQISFGEDDGTFELSVVAPSSFGSAHYSRIRPSRIQSFGDTQTAKYDKAKVSAGSFEITYGNYAVYSLDFNFPLKNTFPMWRNVSVTMPPQLATQDIVIKSVNPRPDSVRVDNDGNVIMTYFMNPLESMTVTTDIVARVKVLEYDLSISGNISEVPAEIRDRYTTNQTYWEKDNEKIIESAKKHFDASKSVAENVRALYRYTIETLTYNDAKIKFNERLGALKALDNPTNSVCMEYADFLIAHLRAVGIPARNPVGYAYSEGLKESPGVSDSLHSWVEVYVPNVGWVMVDPTWGEKIDNFGVSDVDRIAFAVYGEDSDDPQPVKIGRRSAGYQYESTKLEYGEDTPDNTSIRLEAISYPLPFMVMTHVKAINSGNTSIDATNIKADGTSFYPSSEAAFGGSAPYQESEFYFVSPAAGSATATFELTGIGKDGRTIALDSATADLPLGLSNLVGAAAVIFTLWLPVKWLVRKLRKKQVPHE